MKKKIFGFFNKLVSFFENKSNAGFFMTFSILGVIIAFNAFYYNLPETAKDEVNISFYIMYSFLFFSYFISLLFFTNDSIGKSNINKKILFEDELYQHFEKIEKDIIEMQKKGFIDLFYIENTIIWLNKIQEDNKKYFNSNKVKEFSNIILFRLIDLFKVHYIKEKTGITDEDFIKHIGIKNDVEKGTGWVNDLIKKSWEDKNKD